MIFISKLLNGLRNPKDFCHKVYGVLLEFFAPLIDDKPFLKAKWKYIMGYPLDLKNPKTFNEKLQWLKLYDRKEEYVKMVDKYAAKEYVASVIGEKHIIPTLAVYDSVEEIDFDLLPNQFVLKCTHDSGGVFICKDKSIFDKCSAIKKLKKGLKENFFWQNREWPYKNVKPRIIAEKYMSAGTGDLLDYKFMCYDGKCKNVFVCTGRGVNDLRVDFFDVNWNHLPFTRKYKNADYDIEKPPMLSEMIEISEIIASKVDNPFVRVDLYIISGEIYFGEITFYPGSGFEIFSSVSWDKKFGDLINLPTIN